MTSCVPRVRTQVENFSNFPTPYIGGTVHVQAFPAERNNELSWKRYKTIFENELRAKGFTIAYSEKADFLALVSYGISQPTTRQELVSTPVFGQTGGGTTTTHSGSIYGSGTSSYYGTSYTMPTYGVIGSTTNTVTTTTYDRNIAVDIIDSIDKRKVFEGRVKSTGRCGMLSEVIDEMAKALFMKFPSGSGNLQIEGKFNC